MDHHRREEFEHLEHRLGNSAHTKSPYPTFYQGLWSEPEQQQLYNRPHGQQNGDRTAREYFDDNCALWIGNLDPRINETILFELFCQVGTIKNITFPAKKQEIDPSTRFCFVNFMMPDSVPRAIHVMQETVLFGRRLLLKYRPNSIHALPTMQNTYHQSMYTNQKWNKFNNKNNIVREEVTVCPTLSSVVRVGEHVMPMLKDERERSHETSSSEQAICLESRASTKKFSPVRAPSPNTSLADSDVAVGSSPFKVGINRKCSRKQPYYFNDSNGRIGSTPNRKVFIKLSPDTVTPVATPAEQSSCEEGEYDPTDPEIR